jgi:4-amino-4-deoxy-L-arabinose transferase-like glycosyltransferase
MAGMRLPGVGSARPGRWVLFAAAVIGVLAAASPRDLWAPDEPWYGRIAHEMEAGGDWLVPRWNGGFDAEKPPVGYWAMALGGRVAGGVGPVSARVPCALLAALAVLATAALARRWLRDEALGDTAALLFATSGLVLWNSSRAGLDLPMTAFALLAALAGTAVVTRRSAAAALGCGAALGLGVLVKGPHALYVPLAAVVGGCVAAGEARRLRDPRWLLALLATVAVVAAWLVPALGLGEEAYGRRLLGQLGSRVRGENEPHVHAFPFLVPVLLAAGLPWTPAWVAGAAWAARVRRHAAEARFGLGAALCGAALPLLLLSVPATKREVYLIPLLPMLAILGAWALHRAPREAPARICVWAGIALLAGVGVGAPLAPVAGRWLWKGGPDDAFDGASLGEGALPLCFAAVGAVALAGAVLALRRRGDAVAAIRAAGTALGATFVTAAFAVLPAFDRTKTWEEAVGPVRRAAAGAPLFAVGFNDASLAWGFRPDVVPRLAPDPDDAPRVLDGLFAAGAPRAAAAVRSGSWEKALAEVPSLRERTRVVWRRRVGPKVYVVVVPAGSPR